MIYGEAQTVTTNSPTNLMYSVPSQCFSRLIKPGSFSTYHTRYWIFFSNSLFHCLEKQMATLFANNLFRPIFALKDCNHCTYYFGLPIHLYLIFEKSSLKNQVRRTGFLTCKNQFHNWFMQARHAEKNPVQNRLKIKLDFPTWFFKNQVQIK